MWGDGVSGEVSRESERGRKRESEGVRECKRDLLIKKTKTREKEFLPSHALCAQKREWRRGHGGGEEREMEGRSREYGDNDRRWRRK